MNMLFTNDNARRRLNAVCGRNFQVALLRRLKPAATFIIVLFLTATEVRALPDLEVTVPDITFSNDNPAVSQVFTISATVRNNGDAYPITGGNTAGSGESNIGNRNAQFTMIEKNAGSAITAGGAITQWKVYFGLAVAPTVARLRIFRASGSQYLYVGQSAQVTITPGSILTFDCNIPVQAGDLPGIWFQSPDDVYIAYDALAGGVVYRGADITADSEQSLWTTGAYKIKLEVKGGGTVKFFDANPDSGGLQIGTTKYAVPGPGGSDIVSIDWSTGTAGDYDIYVHVDRENFITESNESNNKAYKTITVGTIPDVTAPGKITDLTVTCPADYTAYLQWSSPGDDNYSHTLKSPSKYKIQYSTYNTISWSTTSAQITIDVSNTNPYDSKSYTKGSLDGDTSYYFRIWTGDEVPNWSLSSDSKLVYVTGDTVIPAAVNDLSAQTGCCCRKVDLSWTAPGDDENTGTASEYFVKYATYSITFASVTYTSDTNFNTGTYSSTTVSGSGDSANIVLVKQVLSSTYNFTSGGGTNKWGKYYDEQGSDVGSTDGPVPIGGGANSVIGDITDYASIESSNDIRYVTTINYGSQWAYHHYKFTINQNLATIASLTVSWEGRAAGGSGGTTIYTSKFYIWNFGSGTWNLINSTTGDPDGIISATYNANISDYVSGGYLYILADTQQSGGFVSNFGSDYVKVVVNDAPYFSSGTWTSPVLAANTTAAWEIELTSTTPTGTSVSAITRTGNTAAPDGTWSDWSAEITNPARQGVLSPDAKYIQYRAILKTDDVTLTPQLNDLTLTYTTWWAVVSDATGEPSPAVAGTPQNMTLELYPKTTYYFAIRTLDDADNLSGVDVNARDSVTQSSAVAYYLCPPTNTGILAVYQSSITMKWDLVPYPFENAYVLEASTASNFTGTLHSSVTLNVDLSTLTVMAPALFTNTTYYLRAGALYDGTTAYATPVLSTSTLTNPVLNSAFYGVYESSVTVAWDEFPETPSSSTCEGYMLQASINSNFSSIWRSSSTTDIYRNYLSILTLFSETTYYFRVGGLNWNSVANYVYVGSTETISGTGDGTGTAAFNVTGEEISDATVVEELAIYGNGQSTITAVAVQIPYTWSWTGLASNVTLSGNGFINPDPEHTDPDEDPDIVVSGSGTASDPYIITIGASTHTFITEIRTGTVTISNLTASGAAGKSSDNIFTVWTKGTKALTKIVDQPGIAVHGKLTLETDTTWNPSGAVIKEGSAEYLVAAFTLDAAGENITIDEFTVKFTTVGNASLGSELISFRIYKESNATADGWDSLTDLWLTAGVPELIAETFEKYSPNQNKILTQGDGNRTYYLTVNFSAAPPLELFEGIKADIAASTIIVTGATSEAAFRNTGNFAGNNCYLGGAAAESDEANVLRLGMDRHTFYDGSNYWMFYLEKNAGNADVYFKTSPDGADWSGSAIKLNTTAAVFSSLGIWQDAVYVYATYSNGGNTYIKTVQISDKTPGTEYAVNSAAGNHSQIIIDSTGKLWRKGEER